MSQVKYSCWARGYFSSLRRRANARNISFRISLRWPIHIINPVDETKLSCYTSHRRSTTVSLETYPYIFLRLSLLWGSSEDVLYLDNYAMLLCFFEYWCIRVFHSIFFETFASEIVYFIHQFVVIVQSIWHSLSLRNNLLVLARRIMAIVLLARPFGSEKQNKRDFILLSSCFWHPCISHC